MLQIVTYFVVLVQADAMMGIFFQIANIKTPKMLRGGCLL